MTSILIVRATSTGHRPEIAYAIRRGTAVPGVEVDHP